MQAMLAIKISQRRCTQLTAWMRFHADNVSNQNQANKVHTTHSLHRISCRQCQQSKSSRGSAHNWQTGWDFMQAMSAIKIKQTSAHNSQPGLDFMQTMSAIKMKQRKCTQLTDWMEFHAGNVSNQNQAEEVHTTHSLDGISYKQCQQSKSSRQGAHNSQSEWDFMQAMSAINIKQRRCTQLTNWMGFHADNVSNQNQAEEMHTTHSLDEISCRQCQQWKSSRQGAHNSQSGWDFQCQQLKSSRRDAHNSHPGWDIMQAMSAIKIKQKAHNSLSGCKFMQPILVVKNPLHS